jgi:hypothetical protein
MSLTKRIFIWIVVSLALWLGMTWFDAVLTPVTMARDSVQSLNGGEQAAARLRLDDQYKNAAAAAAGIAQIGLLVVLFGGSLKRLWTTPATKE